MAFVAVLFLFSFFFPLFVEGLVFISTLLCYCIVLSLSILYHLFIIFNHTSV